ncbi:MAG: hypothetical protein AABX05_05035, partial [Nanoarchaeota archaeon]
SSVSSALGATVAIIVGSATFQPALIGVGIALYTACFGGVAGAMRYDSQQKGTIEQLKEKLPAYAEKVAEDIDSLPQNISCLKVLCQYMHESAEENVFYPKRELNRDEQKTAVKFLEHDLPEQIIRLSQIEPQIPSIQEACKEKLTLLQKTL